MKNAWLRFGTMPMVCVQILKIKIAKNTVKNVHIFKYLRKCFAYIVDQNSDSAEMLIIRDIQIFKYLQMFGLDWGLCQWCAWPRSNIDPDLVTSSLPIYFFLSQKSWGYFWTILD